MLDSPAKPLVSGRVFALAMAVMSRLSAVWWLALAVLVINDHVLKHAGVLPAWLTGKLSDFAGLIVAPVLAARLLGARTTRARALAFAVVVIPFCAAKLFAAGADALVTAIGWIGVHWRLWCDPTDLIALAVLPLAWRIAGTSTPARGERLRPAVILGAFACLATSVAVTGLYTSAYLVNMTLDPMEVRVFRARGPLDCAAIASAPASALFATFDPARCRRLGPGQYMPLDQDAFEGYPDAGAPAGAGPPCDAVIIRVADLPDTLLTWQQPGSVFMGENTSNPPALRARDELDPHAIYLERAGDRIFAAASPLITSQSATIVLPDVACDAFPTGEIPIHGVDAGADR